jgi:NitT/TauT family transport system ATP-binding protein
VKIALPRPRTSEAAAGAEFGRYVAEIWGDLRDEASRGMQDVETHSLRAT